jgi:hypothetical protein
LEPVEEKNIESKLSESELSLILTH